jgi:hypothetical protein
VGEAEDIVVAKPVMAAEGGFFVHLLILFWVYWYSGISVYWCKIQTPIHQIHDYTSISQPVRFRP